MKIARKCPLCSKVTEIEVTGEAWFSYQHGTAAQIAFPNHTPMERDVIINGLCFDCSEKMYNVPAPGHEKMFGKRIGDCSCCGCAVWEKDIKDGKFECPTCHETEYEAC